MGNLSKIANIGIDDASKVINIGRADISKIAGLDVPVLSTGTRIEDSALYSDSALKGYWKLDGDFLDTKPTGTKYNLTQVNTVSDETGKFGGAKGFTSTDAGAYVNPGSPAYQYNLAHSIVGWMYPTADFNGQTVMGIFSTWSQYFLIMGNASGGVTGYAHHASYNEDQASQAPYNLNQWNHIALTWSHATTELRMYMNGYNTWARSVNYNNLGTEFILGAGDITANFQPRFYLDDVAVFSKELSSAEINSLL